MPKKVVKKLTVAERKLFEKRIKIAIKRVEKLDRVIISQFGSATLSDINKIKLLIRKVSLRIDKWTKLIEKTKKPKVKA